MKEVETQPAMPVFIFLAGMIIVVGIVLGSIFYTVEDVKERKINRERQFLLLCMKEKNDLELCTNIIKQTKGL